VRKVWSTGNEKKKRDRDVLGRGEAILGSEIDNHLCTKFES
jgi:hypothetical protein